MFRPFEHSPRDPRHSPSGTRRYSHHRGQPLAPATQHAAADETEHITLQSAWLVAPMLLLALACALRFTVRGADSSFATCFAVLLGLGVSWVGLRLLLPAIQSPVCPQCRRKTLVRLDRAQSLGARCLHCSWRDESADARQLGTLIRLEPHFRKAVHAARISLGPRDMRRDSPGGSRSRPFGDRPPQGPSGRGRRLR